MACDERTINRMGIAKEEYGKILLDLTVERLNTDVAPVISSDFPSSIVLTEEKPVYKLALGNMVFNFKSLEVLKHISF